MAKLQKCHLIETTFSESLQIDRENAVIHGVKILGKRSKNNREYTDAAMDQAAGLYEDIRVNVDHPHRRGDDGKLTPVISDRSIADGFGVIKGSHHRRGQGVYGDLHYLKSHPLAEMVIERADRMPHTFGLSHNADGEVSHRNGTMIVEGVERVKSVDLVDQPATNAGLFESFEEVTKVKKTIKEIVKEHGAKANKKSVALLREQMEMDAEVAELPVEVEPEASAEDQVKEAFRAMVIAAFDDTSLDTQATIAKIKEILKAQEKLEGGGGSDDGEDKPNDGEASTPESHKQKPDPATTKLQEQVGRMERREQARDILESHSLTLGDLDADRRKLILAQADEDAMRKLVESWPPVVFAKTGRAMQRPTITSLRENVDSDFHYPKTSEEFAKAIG